MQFLSASLDDLSSLLRDDQLIQLSKQYRNSQQRSVLSKKGVCCYDYMDQMDKFEESKLPDKEHFYNKLNDRHITNKQYRHAQNVWNTL